MEKNKWQLILHEQCEDPYYEITNGPISLIANCGCVGETEAEEDAIFKRIFEALDQSGVRFHYGNALEVNQHIEIQKLKYDIEAIQAQCNRYMTALKIIQQWQLPATGKFWDNDKTQPMSYGACYGSNGERDFMRNIANEALSGEGDKEGAKPIEYMPVHPEDARKPGCPKQFPMHLLNEGRAQLNHGQTLKRLKERGGLGVTEILAIVGDKPWGYYGALKWEEALKMLNAILNQKEDQQ